MGPELFDRARRLDLSLPMEVRGEDASGALFRESCVTLNIAGGAVCFESDRRFEIGAPVELEISLPEALRRHFGGETVYRTRAVVYRTEPAPRSRTRIVARFADLAATGSER